MGVVGSTLRHTNIEETMNGVKSSIQYSPEKRNINTSLGVNIYSLKFKRIKVKVSNIIDGVEGILLGMSVKVLEAYPKEVVDNGTSKKKDDSPVPFELWLY